MESLFNLAVKKYSRELYDWGGPSEGEGPYDGTVDIDNNGRLDIDCSHLVNNVLVMKGYDIPYLSTSQLNSDEARRYFINATLEEAGPDDLILYPHHVGIFGEFNKTYKEGNFFGSQSKGPGLAKFDEKGTYGWKMNFVILRPRLEYLRQGSSQKQSRVAHKKHWRVAPGPRVVTGAVRWRLAAGQSVFWGRPEYVIRWQQ